MNLLMKAIREKFEFPSSVGVLDLYQLSNLPLTSERGASLDQVARNLSKRIKESESESFVETATPSNVRDQESLEIVKEFIRLKKEEREEAAKKREKATLKAKLHEILEQKREQSLMNSSEEDILKKLEELG